MFTVSTGVISYHTMFTVRTGVDVPCLLLVLVLTYHTMFTVSTGVNIHTMFTVGTGVDIPYNVYC